MLSEFIRKVIIDEVDHRNLNTDVESLRSLNPTTEVLVSVFWDRLETHFLPRALWSVWVGETEKNWAERRRPPSADMRLPDTEPRRNKAPDSLAARYRPIDLTAFTPEELRRYMALLDPREVAAAPTDARAWRRVSRVLGWELLYRIEPELYERLIAGEQLHPGILDWLPRRVDRAVEVGAGTGRLTLDLAPRCGHLVAVEPAEPMRRRLQAKLDPSGVVEARPGFFDTLPVPTGWADLAITCSAFTLDLAHGAEAGLTELERVTRPGGLVVIVWPPDPAWLGARGYVHLSFPGEMAVEFGSPEEAVELARIFYPDSEDEVARRGERRVPYEVLRINPPRDLCWKGV